MGSTKTVWSLRGASVFAAIEAYVGGEGALDAAPVCCRVAGINQKAIGIEVYFQMGERRGEPW